MLTMLTALVIVRNFFVTDVNVSESDCETESP